MRLCLLAADFMGEIVYILGAEINNNIEDFDGLSPPSSKNFFNAVLKKREFNNENFEETVKDVYDYIEKNWNLTKEDLVVSSFNYEKCLTLLEYQSQQALIQENMNDYKNLMITLFKLKKFIASVFYYFEHFAFASKIMRNLGQVIFYEKPTIITFNSDCILEYVLESIWGKNINIPLEHFTFEDEEIPDELLAYSRNNWNKRLGYGFKFDEIQLQQAGVNTFVKGSKYYAIKNNELYSNPLLKLYGSINWFRYFPIRYSHGHPNEVESKIDHKEFNVLLIDGAWWYGKKPEHNGLLLDPVVITPSLYKEKYHDVKPFKEIWEIAKKKITHSEKLIVINHSFQPDDFITRQLFLEAYIDSRLKDLIIINPDPDQVKIIKELYQFEGSVTWYSTLDDYLQTFEDIISFKLDNENNRARRET